MFELFKIMGTVGVNNSDANAALDDTDRKAQQTGKSMGQSFLDGAQKVGKGMQTAGKFMTKWVTGPLVAVGTGMAVAVMDLEASEAKYNTVFEGMTDKSDAFIKEFQNLTPATTAEARAMASGIQDLLVPMGMARDEATDMTGDMMHLTGALANFNSGTHSATDVSNAFQSALLGQYQPLQSLGIQLSKTEVEQRALEDGLADTAEELTKADLAQTMMTMAYEQSGDALHAYTEENLDAKTKMGLMKAEIIDVAASFGQHMLPIINDVIGGVRGAVEWFGNLTEEQQRTILIVAGVVAAIGPMLLIFGKILVSLPKLVQGYKLLTGALSAKVAIVAGVLVAIAALVAGIVWLYNNNEQARAIIDRVWNAIRTTISSVVQAVVSFVKGLWGGFTSWWGAHSDQIMQVATTAFKIISNVIRSVMGTLTPFIKGTWQIIQTVISSTMEIIGSVISLILGVIRGDWTQVWNAIKNIVTTVMNAVRSVISTVLNTIKSIFSSNLNSIMSTVTSIFNRIRSTITNTINGARDAVRNAIERMKGFFNFKWELPKIKMPRFSVSGSANPLNWLKEGVPKLNVEWFAKGGILEGPTAFGMNGNSIMAGGEAGREAVLPLNKKTLGGIGAGIAQASGFDIQEIKQMLQGIMNELRNIGNKPVHVDIMLDGKVIARVIQDPLDKENGRKVKLIERGMTRS